METRRARPQVRRDGVTVVLGAVLVGGVFTDGWAHFNRPGLETFFTPWHAILYSSLALMTAWLLVVAYLASGGRIGEVRSTLPRGYGLGLVGAAVFAGAGLADLVWHQLFGIEVAVDALLSPTHLALGAGGILILSTAMRSQGLLGREAEGRWTGPARVSLALSLAVVVFFLLYVSPFPEPGPLQAFTPPSEGAPEHEAQELPVIAALASYLVTTVVVVLAALLLSRGSRLVPRGGAVLSVATVALLPVVVVDLPTAPLAGALGSVAAAVLFEVAWPFLASRLSPWQGSWVMPALLAGLIWAGQLTGLALVATVEWPVSLWSGVVVLGAFLAGVVGFVGARSAAADRTHDTVEATATVAV